MAHPRHRFLVQHLLHAGQKLTPHPTIFELRRAGQCARGLPPWAPFASHDEWQLAQWIIDSNISQGNTEKLLRLGLYHIAREAAPDKFASFHSNASFMDKIDSLPGPQAKWKLYEITVEGTLVGENGEKRTETLDLWARDANEVIADLMGNSELGEGMTFEPTRKFRANEGAEIDDAPVEEMFDDIPSARWMWDLQKQLPEGATIAPVILASDKTQLSTFSGDKQAWPVYITIGNIDKSIRKSPSRRAMVLLGYLPASKLQCFSPSERSLQGYRIFHYAMSLLLEPLVSSGRDGIDIVCADGWIRRVFPILAAYLADHPEQCLIACCKENRCPTCPVHPDDRGEPADTCYRDPENSLAAMQDPSDSIRFDEEGLRHIPEPFWANLPHSNIFTCIIPDLLHQLHKGVFKDHLVKWVSADDEAELDARMMRIPPYHGLRLFKKGITGIQQWTGNEYRQMERVFVGAISGMHTSQPRILTSARAILDFIFLAHLPSHTSSSLSRLQDVLGVFHDNKAVFVQLGIRPHFNIPKVHWLVHYPPSIANLGPCDGLSTDISERLHIDYCKMGYRASNRREYIQQMIVWLARREKVRDMESYLRWCLVDQPSSAPSPPNAARASTDPLDTALTEPPMHSEPLTVSHSESALHGIRTTVFNLSNAPLPHSMRPPTNDSTEHEEIDNEKCCGDYKISRSPGLGVLHGHAIQSTHNAPSFARALQEFILSESPAVPGSTISTILTATFSVYKQFSRALPLQHPTIREQPFQDRVRACPAIGKRAAYFDTVLVRTARGDSGLDASAVSESLQDYRVAQVKAIFMLPPHLQRWRADPTRHDSHLVYVEWFTPFLEQRDPLTHLYRISRSYASRERKAAVIPISQIFRSCHLTPVWGDRVDRSWTSDTALERADDFHFNEFCDHYMYSFVNNV